MPNPVYIETNLDRLHLKALLQGLNVVPLYKEINGEVVTEDELIENGTVEMFYGLGAFIFNIVSKYADSIQGGTK